MKKLLVTAALVAVSISSGAFAQDEQGGHVRFMRDMTRAEAKQQADAMFERFDANHDGIVTKQEAEQVALQFGGGERLQRMIDSRFGLSPSLTLVQFEAQALARFDRDDLNHDGVVTGAERQQARAMLKAERAGEAPPQPQVPPPPPGQ